MKPKKLLDRIDCLLDDLRDTHRARARSDFGTFRICRICGAPTVNGERCTRCEREFQESQPHQL